MENLSRRRDAIDRLTVVQAIHDLHAQSPAFRDAVISEPLVGPAGAVILDVSIGQDTAFRVVAPTADEAYALLHELIDSMIDTARRARGIPVRNPPATCGRRRGGRARARARPGFSLAEVLANHEVVDRAPNSVY